jgi:hypothetical protein
MKDMFRTHMPVNIDVMSFLGRVPCILEFGGGDYSTKLFLQHTDRLITVEQGQNVAEETNSAWLEHLKQAYGSCPNWTLEHRPGKDEWMSYSLPVKPDYAFVDGHGDCRFQIVNWLVTQSCPAIGAHDTEQPSYNWSKVHAPEYSLIQYRGDEVFSSIWTTNKFLALALLCKRGYFAGGEYSPLYI